MSEMPTTMTASAPWPHELEDLIHRVDYVLAPQMRFKLQHGTWDEGTNSGLRLIITVSHANSYGSYPCTACGQAYPSRRTQFHYPVPMASYDRASWQRWLFDRVLDVHRHETGEALVFAYERREESFGDTITVLERPFAPHHGPGRDPNRTVEVGISPLERVTLQDGSRAPAMWWDGCAVHDDAVHAQCIEREAEHHCIPVQVVASPEVVW